MKVGGKYLSRVGLLYLELEDQILTKVDFLDKDDTNLKEAHQLTGFRSICDWLDEYFGGKIPSDLPKLQLKGTDFQKEVWTILSQIPYGHWVSYGQIAKALEEKLNRPMSAQAVGQAVGANPIAVMLPCHRVLGRDMNLTGFRGGIERKRALLELEGFKDGKFKKYDL